MRLYPALLLVLALGACGSAYISPKVLPAEADVAVRVVPLTAENVLIANRESLYAPRRLPSAFDQTAGAGSGLRGMGALPDPVIEPQDRPVLTTRIPAVPPALPYTIGVGDVIVLATKQSSGSVEQLTGLLAAQNRRQGYTVQDDGAISIPDVGRIRLGGMTLEEAEIEVFQRLVENQIEPSFSLEIAEFNSKRVSIGGAVGKPSVVNIRLTPLYLQEALLEVGGVAAPDQNLVSVRIYRDGAIYQVPLSELYSRPELQKIQLVDGDSVFVDTEYDLRQAQDFFNQQITIAQIRQESRRQALAELETEVAIQRAALNEQRQNFQARLELGGVERDYVYLAGEVRQQSRFALPFGQDATLADALYDNNGIPLETGNPAQIYVLRASADPRDMGATTAWHLDASNAINLLLATRFELRPNDIIFVAEQPITRWNRVVRQIVPSLISTGANALR